MATGSPPRKRREKRTTPEGLALAHARRRLGYTQRELATLVGVHHSLIAQAEVGWCLLPERVARAAADVLRIPLELLVAPEEASA